VADLDRASRFMQELVAGGVYFALDDFGVGYSSLFYLARVPVDALKIDRSFIRDLPGDHRSETTVRAIIALAHALDLHVVAEGIETREQMQHVKLLGCDTLQGYWLGRPMPAADLEALLARNAPIMEVRNAAPSRQSSLPARGSAAVPGSRTTSSSRFGYRPDARRK
jgi:EAL domain-containing protein (putative c-di-GMP-specific phosphodiesterase class I)